MGRHAALVAALLAAAQVGSCSNQSLSQQTFTDVFRQAAENKVDILFVVDNSQSMNEEQEAVAENFIRFMDQIEESNTDWQVGVVTTDMVDPAQRGRLIAVPRDGSNPSSTLVKVLTPAFPRTEYVEIFSRMVHVGTTGSKLERGLDAARFALTPPLINHENEGFLRAEAAVAIIVVSDENDCSDDGAIPGNSSEDCSAHSELLVPVADFVSAFRSLKEDSSQVVFSSIIGVEATEDQAACPESYPGLRYRQVTELMGGLVLPICDDFYELMDDLGVSVGRPRDRFQLSRTAAVETIVVTVEPDSGEPWTVQMKGDAEGASGWTFDPETNFITFWNDAIPPRGATIHVEYRISSGPSTVTDA
ncbi:hypothetical protein L6R50_00300 [Myxococcota bacterium]|nr:hypothetical protein [Myxococcota bacterium]